MNWKTLTPDRYDKFDDLSDQLRSCCKSIETIAFDLGKGKDNVGQTVELANDIKGTWKQFNSILTEMGILVLPEKRLQ